MRAAWFSIALFSLVVAGCGHTLPNTVKVYEVAPPDGLVRKQAVAPDPKLVPFPQAKGYLCETPADFRQTVACSGGAVKVYSIQPDRGGLYRKQADELVPYADARGWFCASPDDFRKILEACAR